MLHRGYPLLSPFATIVVMKRLIQLLEDTDLAGLASRSHLRLGKEMADAGAIEQVQSGPFIAQAVVAFRNAQNRTVRFDATPKGLRFKCSCSARKNNFCSHLVAVALVLRTRAE